MDAAEADQGARVMTYSLHGTFVRPIAWQAGLGLTLLANALRNAKSAALDQGFDRFDVRVLIGSENKGACRTYEKAGFKTVGLEGYVQKLEKLVSKGEGSATGTALVMELDQSLTK
ncbi:hypothetical protein LTR66_001342 [Elasticomyces elasticus]|nr:hypothetical protein LTR66_001342 [Elasticomyces elasticus]